MWTNLKLNFKFVQNYCIFVYHDDRTDIIGKAAANGEKVSGYFFDRPETKRENYAC